MAEAFEDRLYALIAEYAEDPADIEYFKAKGDAAFVFADLKFDYEYLDDALFALMTEFGVPMPYSNSKPQGSLFSAGYWELREVTVGELKQSVLSGRWPEGAWSYHRKRWWDHVFTAIMLPISMIAGIVLMPVLLIMAVGAWLFNRVFRKPA